MARARRAAGAKKSKPSASLRQGPTLSPSALVTFGFGLLLGAYHLVFGGFFPNAHGKVGGDYSGEGTYRLAGYFWAHVNGPFAVPWFTPAFCGGLPFFGDPQTSYYSIPQLFAAFTDPISASYLTALLFASLGFWGMWKLLRDVLHTERASAFLGGALFMFNGFFAHRMIMGHVIFHGFMLLPSLLWILLKPLPETRREIAIAIDALSLGLIVGYWVQAGMASMIAPSALAALAVIFLFGALGGNVRPTLLRGFPAAAIACGLSASKLAAAGAFLSHFDRSSYVLPQTGSLFASLELVLATLFISPASIAESAKAMLVRKQWEVSRWEWEYGVTIVPLFILIAASVLAFRRPRGERSMSRPRLASALGLVAILLLPIALNTYSPTWLSIIKTIPIIKSTSVLFRWFVIYIPVVVAGAAVALDRLGIPARARNAIAIAGVIAMVLINFAADRNSYQREEYAPGPIDDAFNKVSRGEATPHISGIDAEMSDSNQVVLPLARNDSMVSSLSQLACYNPIFGYRLETFPFKTLHKGPALEEGNGVLNLKNPACYLFPEENGCAPGDHFRISDRASAEALLAYRPFPFEFSRRQRIANAVTEATLALIVALGLALSTLALTNRKLP